MSKTNRANDLPGVEFVLGDYRWKAILLFNSEDFVLDGPSGLARAKEWGANAGEDDFLYFREGKNRLKQIPPFLCRVTSRLFFPEYCEGNRVYNYWFNGSEWEEQSCWLGFGWLLGDYVIKNLGPAEKAGK